MINLTLNSLFYNKIALQTPFIIGYGLYQTRFFNLYSSYFSNFQNPLYFSSFSSATTIKNSLFTNFSDSVIILTSLDQELKETKLRYQSLFHKSDLKVKYCIFDRCVATKYTCGGAIFANHSKVSITDSIFDAARAKDSGGAVCFNQCPYVEISQTGFQRDMASYSSGSAHFYLCFDIKITDTNFTEEISTLRTACISILSNDRSIIKFCDFFNNTAKIRGVLRSDTGDFELNNSRFILTEKKITTTILRADYISKYNIENCLFSSAHICSIEWNSVRAATVSNCKFVSVEKDAFGGSHANNIQQGPGNNTFSYRAKIFYPILYGTPYLPEPTRSFLPSTPPMTPQRTTPPRTLSPTRSLLPTRSLSPTRSPLPTISATPTPSRKPRPRIEEIKKYIPTPTQKVEITYNNNIEGGKKAQKQPIPSPKPTDSLNLENKEGNKDKSILQTTERPAINPFGINLIYIVIVSGVLFLVIALIAFNMWKKHKLEERNNSVFTKLDKNVKLTRNSRFKNADDFFE